MKTDRELLELAAKAAGHKTVKWVKGVGYVAIGEDGNRKGRFNPLTDDGDSFRLMVSLGLPVNLCFDAREVTVGIDTCQCIYVEDISSSPAKEVRRAIVRAAAAIGEAMP